MLRLLSTVHTSRLAIVLGGAVAFVVLLFGPEMLRAYRTARNRIRARSPA